VRNRVVAKHDRPAASAPRGKGAPEGRAVEELDAKGLVMRSVLAGDGVRVVSEVVRLEARDVPDATFVLPVDYRQTGAITRTGS